VPLFVVVPVVVPVFGGLVVVETTGAAFVP